MLQLKIAPFRTKYPTPCVRPIYFFQNFNVIFILQELNKLVETSSIRNRAHIHSKKIIIFFPKGDIFHI
ncbi:hypothetical protein LF95_13205 [Thalassospira sp. TSL5-1]|nr:hypothetical protein LF95_13205 [Thalassospira sp. TSL5-1]